jgi:glycosyltransferase involved in cell wall biosynthesis
MGNEGVKVLHLPTTVGGNPQGLSRHLNYLGLKSVTWTLFQNSYNYPADVVLCDEKDSVFVCQIKRLKYVYQELFQYDVIHFNFGTTLFKPISRYGVNQSFWEKVLRYFYASYTSFAQLAELTLLKTLKKPLFVHYQGDDARQGDYCLNHFKYNVTSQVDDTYYNSYSDAFKRKQIQRMEKYCERIYSVNPDLLHVLPSGSRFIPYSHVSLEEWRPVYTQGETERPLRIGHAPSNRRVKGTELLLDALSELKETGFTFELVLVEGLSNAMARSRYETIDVLVDQVFCGWYGGVAVEAMALGKPVLVYIREDDLKFIPAEMKADLPFVQLNPDNIKKGLKEVLLMPREELLSLAKRSRAFVEKWHDPLKIAQEIKTDYEIALRKYGKL